MLIRTNQSIRMLEDYIFRNEYFGTPKYKTKSLDGTVFIIYEQYTLRNGNYMTISILLEDREEYRNIHYITSGSAQGILKFDWGASKNRVTRLLNLLEEKNFDYKIIKE